MPRKVAVYPGSFDPIHNGHLGIIEVASRLFDEVVVATVRNPQKGEPLFTLSERQRLIGETTSHLDNVRITMFSSLVVELARGSRGDRLVELAGNAKLLEVYRRLVNELQLCRHAALAQRGVLPVSTREHRAIVDRIAAGKPAAAGRALFDHVMGSRERMHRSLALPAAPPERPARKKP